MCLIMLVKCLLLKLMLILSSFRRLFSRICANCLFWRMYMGIFNKCFIGVIGCYGLMIFVFFGVGCVVMVVWFKNLFWNYLCISDFALIFVVVTFINVCIILLLFVYFWLKYILVIFFGVKFVMSLLGILFLMVLLKVFAVGLDMLTRSRMFRLTCALYCVL